MLSLHGWLGGSAHGFRFAFELASFIMLSPREWLEGSASEPQFAFELASFIMLFAAMRWMTWGAVPNATVGRGGRMGSGSRLSWRVLSCYRRVNGLRAVPMGSGSRLSWRVLSCYRRVNGLRAVLLNLGSRFGWLVSQAIAA